MTTRAGSRFPARSTEQPEILKVTPRPIDLVYALRRRWGWAIGLGILAAIAAAVTTWLVVPENYTATAWLRIARDKPSIIFKVGTDDDMLKDKRATATLMKSRFVLNEALRKPGVSQLPYLRDEDDKLTWLKEKIQVSFPGNSQILQIGMTGDDPSQLVTLVNSVKDAYMEEVVGVDRENHLRRKRVLETSYHRNMEQIKKKTASLKNLGDEIGAPGSEAFELQRLAVTETVEDLRADVIDLQGDLSGRDLRINFLESRLQKFNFGEDEDAPQDEESLRERILELERKHMFQQLMASDPWIANAQNQIVALDAARFEEKQRALHDDAPSILRMTERIEKYQGGIDERIKEMQPQWIAQVDEYMKDRLAGGAPLRPPTSREQAIALLEGEKLDRDVLAKKLEEKKQAFEDLLGKRDEIGDNIFDLETQKTELDRLKKITERMGSELDQWQVELAAAPRVSVLEPASVPKSSDIKKKYRYVGFFAAAAFGFAVLGVAAVDFLSRRVNSPDEVAYGLGVQVMGDVPSLSGRRQRGALGGGAAAGPLQGILAESIDNIRTALLYRAAQDGIRVAMVTSSLEKEGKTTVSSQLAASLARSGRRTLYLDGDLRRPSAHRLFELPVGPGVCEVLRGEVLMEDVVRPTRVAGLWMIPAGRVDQDAVQALASDAMREDFAKLREEFDFIMIDSGPVLTDSDALLFGRYADAVLLSVLRDVSRVPQVYEACERIRAVNIPLMGAVVNGVSMGKYRSYYRPYTADAEA